MLAANQFGGRRNSRDPQNHAPKRNRRMIGGAKGKGRNKNRHKQKNGRNPVWRRVRGSPHDRSSHYCFKVDSSWLGEECILAAAATSQIALKCRSPDCVMQYDRICRSDNRIINRRSNQPNVVHNLGLFDSRRI